MKRRRDPLAATGADTTIDPRLRARRVEVASARRRRRNRALVAFALLVTVLGGAWLLAYRSPVLDVDQVSVGGATRSRPADLRRATDVSTGSALASVDLSRVQRRVQAQPWVLDAVVTRRWPGTLRVTVTERTPVAVIGDLSDRMLVDRTGRALGPAPAAPKLPAIGGMAVAPGTRIGGTSTRLARVIGELPARARAQVARAATSRGTLTFTLTDGVTVRWGDDASTAEKARSMMLLLDKADRATIATIDVSVPSAAALTRKDGPVA